MEELIRAFVALDILDSVKDEFSLLISSLNKASADVNVKWIEPKNIHLTLKFLGYISSEQIDQVKEVLNPIASTEKVFSIHFAGLGGFPSLERPRVLWVGMNEGKEPLEELAVKIESELCKIGFAKENRPFSAHVTLGRLKGNKNLQRLVKAAKDLTFHSAYQVQINQLTLYKSTLTRQGAIYELIQQWVFKG